MPRPRRCQVRADEQHGWVIAGEQFICAECKEPGPDINEVLGMIWDVRGPVKESAEDRHAFLHDVLIPRAWEVLLQFREAVAVLEAELAAEGKRLAGWQPPSAEGRRIHQLEILEQLQHEQRRFLLLGKLTPEQARQKDLIDSVVPVVAELTGLTAPARPQPLT